MPKEKLKRRIAEVAAQGQLPIKMTRILDKVDDRVPEGLIDIMSEIREMSSDKRKDAQNTGYRLVDEAEREDCLDLLAEWLGVKLDKEKRERRDREVWTCCNITLVTC